MIRHAFGRLIHHPTEHADSNRRFLILMYEANDLNERSADAAGEHLKCYQRSNRYLTIEDQVRTADDYRDHEQLLQQTSYRLGHLRYLPDFELHSDCVRCPLIPVSSLS